MNPAVVRIDRLSGDAVREHLDEVAALRMAVFREWPYLYDGDRQYEHEYLRAYAGSARSVFVLAVDGQRVVGAATGIPLCDDQPAFSAPFRARGIDPAQVFYFGESVLLPEYRGCGIGHRFFDEREAHASGFGDYRWTAFCAVVRDLGDPRRPPEYRPLDAFWRRRGYAPQEDMTVELDWKEPWHEAPETHTLRVWLRQWPRM
ncbi:MAG TPA: GNAT family N-acetyltransferase [Xanthomonadaceae bacterium]|nr:GNAT family N-acetyltransferase [Xanthomonadaceae bacterium]